MASVGDIDDTNYTFILITYMCTFRHADAHLLSNHSFISKIPLTYDWKQERKYYHIHTSAISSAKQINVVIVDDLS